MHSVKQDGHRLYLLLHLLVQFGNDSLLPLEVNVPQTGIACFQGKLSDGLRELLQQRLRDSFVRKGIVCCKGGVANQNGLLAGFIGPPQKIPYLGDERI
jgi:hypothetical protein